MPGLVTTAVLPTVMLFLAFSEVDSFSNPILSARTQLQAKQVASEDKQPSSSNALRLSGWSDDNSYDKDVTGNTWKNDFNSKSANEDWQTTLKRKKDGSYWSDFEINKEDDETFSAKTESNDKEEIETATMLDALASVEAEELSFNVNEAKRADTQRQMEEWGFDADTIASSLDVAAQEQQEENMENLKKYYKDEATSYILDEDLATIESHKNVEMDPDTNEPVRSQMVYVDEHACIGCTK